MTTLTETRADAPQETTVPAVAVWEETTAPDELAAGLLPGEDFHEAEDAVAAGGPSVRDITIEPGVILPSSATLEVGKSYTVTIRHTLHVQNDANQVLQDNMRMTFDFPGVASGPKSWSKNVYVKRRQTKSFSYNTTVQGLKPKNAGEFNLIGRTEFLGKVGEKSVKFTVRG